MLLIYNPFVTNFKNIYLIGMLGGVFKDKRSSGKDYLAQLESKSLDEVQKKIDAYQNEFVASSDNVENEHPYIGVINYAKYYENTIFMGDSLTKALSEFDSNLSRQDSNTFNNDDSILNIEN